MYYSHNYANSYITLERKCADGIVTKVDIQSTGVSFFDGAFLPGVCLPDAERFKARYTIQLRPEDESHGLTFKMSGFKSRYWYWNLPHKGSRVTVVLTRVRLLGFTVSLISRKRLEI